jgi:hypothetical protein
MTKIPTDKIADDNIPDIKKPKLHMASWAQFKILARFLFCFTLMCL